MFGNPANKAFGQSTAFGANTAFGAAPSTAFGQNTTTGFGLKQNTPVFGGFGSTATQPAGTMFNTNTIPASTGLFGQSAAFGTTPAPAANSSFGFGQPTTASSLFGSTAQPSSSMGLFGTSTASAFATPRPSFGSTFTSASTPSLFGQPQAQPQAQPQGGLFGSSAVNTGGLFGSSGFTNTPSGTVVKFNPPTGTDTMMKNGVSTNISTRHQCITCMKEYENKSLEELRMEDYQANRKGPQQSVGFGATSTGGGLFGSTPATSTFSFNATPSKPLFGGTGTSTFGTTTPSLFGQSSTTGLFNKPLPFGTTTTAPTTGSTFTFGNTNTGLFGQTNQAKPVFGQTTTTNLFGAPAPTSQPSSVFGATSSFGTNVFGQPTQQTGFMGIKPTFGATPATTSSSFSFGNTTNTTGGGLFGPKLTGTATTFPSTGFSFTTPQTNTLGMFNQNKTTQGFAAPAFGTTGGLQTGFTGLGSFGSTLNTTGGTSLFGNTMSNVNKPGTFSFAPSGSTFPSFGNSTTQVPSLGFGTTGGLNLGMDPSASLLNQNQAQQQILALTNYPFSDSPLFRNLIQDTNKREEMLKPTNPGAQKALTTNHKVSTQPVNKLKPKSIQGLSNGKASLLFDGLEEEASNLALDVFVPRQSVKKLTIKPKVSIDKTKIDSNMASPGLQMNSSFSTHTARDIPKLHLTDLTPESATRDKLKSTHSSGFLSKFEDISTRNLSALENTISELKPHSRKMFEVAQSVSTDQTESDTDNQESHLDLSEKEQTENEGSSSQKESVTNAAGITLDRAGYYTIPSLETLSKDENGACLVENFTIGRENYGNVFFPGVTNVADLNLDEIVHFRRKEVVIYLDDDNKPPVGEGLNKKAQVTLDNVWPVDKTTHVPITSPSKIIATKFEDKLEKASVRLGAKFIEYRPETGSWVFQVLHFSNYGLNQKNEVKQ